MLSYFVRSLRAKNACSHFVSVEDEEMSGDQGEDDMDDDGSATGMYSIRYHC